MTRYAISDLHGHYELYVEIKNRLKPDDILYVLGDCADRGPQGWRTLKAVLEDPQCMLLMGNHEVMLRDTMKEWFFYFGEAILSDPFDIAADYADERIIYCPAKELLDWNGGSPTFWDWRKEENFSYWYKRVCQLPYEFLIVSKDIPICLTHAGYTFGNRPKSEDDWVWNRNHFYEKWPEGDNGIVVHGHSPITYLQKQLNDYAFYKSKPLKEFEILGQGYDGKDLFNLTYCDGHKIDIDPCTIVTKRGILLNLETFEQTLIEFDWEKDEAERQVL